jgi:hypothetical protein
MVKKLVNAEYIRIVMIGATPAPTRAAFKRKQCCANLLDFRIPPSLLHDIRINYTKFLHIAMDLINALPGNSFVNTNTGSRRETVFSMRSAPRKSTEL